MPGWSDPAGALRSHSGSLGTYGSLDRDTNDHSGCQLHPSGRPAVIQRRKLPLAAVFVLLSCFYGAFVWFGGHSAQDVPAVQLAATGHSSHIGADSWFVRVAGRLACSLG